MARENGRWPVNEQKEGRREETEETAEATGRPGGGARRPGRTEEGGGNRELTSLIHLLVAFPVYILLPAESTSAFKDARLEKRAGNGTLIFARGPAIFPSAERCIAPSFNRATGEKSNRLTERDDHAPRMK